MKRNVLIYVLIIAALAAFMSCTLPAGPDDTKHDIAISFLGAIQSGGTFAAANTTALTLSFNVDPTFLMADNITLTGATKGTFSGTGLSRTLAISDITVMNGATVSVAINCPAGSVPSGYAFQGATQTARVYRPTYIGMDFMGGKIGYLLQSGDPGYDANVSHGLIAALYDSTAKYKWSPSLSSIATGTAFGMGRANTDLLIAEYGSGSDYAAGIARAYTGGGFTDWYLPSRDELIAIIRNKDVIGITMNCYKSSSQYDTYMNYGVWSNGASASEEDKNLAKSVCAVRNF